MTFQLTTSQGGRLSIPAEKSISEHFNSRPHKEVDSLGVATIISDVTFQLTTSQGGRPFLLITRSWMVYFNSRPHKEVDILKSDIFVSKGISTHDLTRRSTLSHSCVITGLLISTHDLTRRSTEQKARIAALKIFQLTTSQGGRRIFLAAL